VGHFGVPDQMRTGWEYIYNLYTVFLSYCLILTKQITKYIKLVWSKVSNEIISTVFHDGFCRVKKCFFLYSWMANWCKPGLSSFDSYVALIFTPITNLFPFEWTVSTLSKFTRNIKGPSNMLIRSRCHGLQPLLTVLLKPFRSPTY